MTDIAVENASNDAAAVESNENPPLDINDIVFFRWKADIANEGSSNAGSSVSYRGSRLVISS